MSCMCRKGLFLLSACLGASYVLFSSPANAANTNKPATTIPARTLGEFMPPGSTPPPWQNPKDVERLTEKLAQASLAEQEQDSQSSPIFPSSFTATLSSSSNASSRLSSEALPSGTVDTAETLEEKPSKKTLEEFIPEQAPQDPDVAKAMQRSKKMNPDEQHQLAQATKASLTTAATQPNPRQTTKNRQQPFVIPNESLPSTRKKPLKTEEASDESTAEVDIQTLPSEHKVVVGTEEEALRIIKEAEKNEQERQARVKALEEMAITTTDTSEISGKTLRPEQNSQPNSKTRKKAAKKAKQEAIELARKQEKEKQRLAKEQRRVPPSTPKVAVEKEKQPVAKEKITAIGKDKKIIQALERTKEYIDCLILDLDDLARENKTRFEALKEQELIKRNPILSKLVTDRFELNKR
ncbi:MAG: hypothetical protein RLZ12_450, partial [Bacillota bacterium]